MKEEEIDKIIAESLAESKQRKWKRPSDRRKRVEQWRNLLNLAFMLGFAAAIIIYFAWPEQRVLFFSVGFGAMLLKIVEFVLRWMA